MSRRILVTSALPYANGPIHLGHLVEYIQTDIWARFQRLRGNECYYVCADDAHGTPIMLKARERDITPEALIEEMAAQHQEDFAHFLIDFDCYHSTHSDENRHYAELIYQRLDAAGHIERRTISQLYDPAEGMFLPDRYIRGGCPRCGAEDQYGDSCEACGATYTPAELVEPRSVLSGEAPELRDSEHFFFRLGDFEAMLRDWALGDRLQSEVANKLLEWFDDRLRDWDISRDAPYFGFQIPGTAADGGDPKYFYVWLDAPIGYMASFRRLCNERGIDFDAFWNPGHDTELYHFIGKDIAYFHTLFWPAMLHGAGFRTPTGVFCHGFLTVDGQKMSKSRGTFIQAATYRRHLDPEDLRYYIAGKLTPRVEDIDLSLDDFVQRINSDIVGKLVNIASRSASFIHRKFDGRLADHLGDASLYRRFSGESERIAERYEQRDYARAMREIMALADEANQFVDAEKPWERIKQPEHAESVHAVCTLALNLFRVLVVYIKPVMPQLAEAAERFLALPPQQWADVQTPLLDHPIEPFQPLKTRIQKEDVDAVIEESRQDLSPADAQSAGRLAEDPIDAEITIDDFAKLDLRVAEVRVAESVEGADKLLRLELDLDGETRQVFAGVAQAYTPEQLVGRRVVMVANLKPRKMRFGVSEGMVLCAGPGGDALWVVGPESGAEPGMRVK